MTLFTDIFGAILSSLCDFLIPDDSGKNRKKAEKVVVVVDNDKSWINM
jgi:hypothetical protein